MTETVPVPADTPQVLLEHHLKALRLPTFLREYRGESTTRWRGSAPPRMWIIRATCCA